jgi:DNA-binding MarR family transcriptional regulator
MGVGNVTHWLSQKEQESWRAWLDMTRLLPDRLSRELSAKHGLSGADYEILVQLSENPDRRIRMSDLADRTLSSRSRLTHQFDRLAKHGFVTREPCTDDGRGSWAVLTQLGWEKIQGVAPVHVATVREHFVDLLTPSEFEELGRISRKISEHLQSINLENRD